MSLHYSPRIVTDNLIYYFDPINTKCYPGSGNTFTDLSIYKSPGSLSGVVFNTDDGGFAPGPLSTQPWSPAAGAELNPGSPPGGYVPYLSAQFVNINIPLTGTELTIITTKKQVINYPSNTEYVLDIYSSFGNNIFSSFDQTGSVIYVQVIPSASACFFVLESQASLTNYSFYDAVLSLSSIDMSKIKNKVTTWAFVYSEITQTGKCYIFNDEYTKEINLIRDNSGSIGNVLCYTGPRPFRNVLFLNKNYYYSFTNPPNQSIPVSEIGTGYTRLSTDVTTYNLMMYNRALTPQEVKQNYNAIKSRYIK